jgi:hypothetical protein
MESDVEAVRSSTQQITIKSVSSSETAGSEKELEPERSEELNKQIDFILVWCGREVICNAQKSVDRRRIFEYNLEKEGLILTREKLSSKELHFIKIHAPQEVLVRYAEILRLQMPIKEVKTIFMHV